MTTCPGLSPTVCRGPRRQAAGKCPAGSHPSFVAMTTSPGRWPESAYQRIDSLPRARCIHSRCPAGCEHEGWGIARKTKSAPPWGADYTKPDYRAWLDYVVKTVNAIKAAIPLERRVYDFWNEPNNAGYWSDWDPRERKDGSDPGPEADFIRLKECWKLTYQLIKKGLGEYQGRNYGAALDPQAKVTAPGTAGGDNETAFTKDFMTYADAEGCVPDYWNWHFGGTQIAERVRDRMSHARALGADRDVMILEYLSQEEGKRPGRAAYEISLLEQVARVGSTTGLVCAAQARWPSTDELGNSLFFSDGAWRKHGVWHVYASYARISGARAPVNTSGPVKLHAVAALDRAKQAGWALLGNEKPASQGADTIGTVSLELRNLRSADESGRVRVTLRQIPYDNFGEVTDAEVNQLISSQTYAVEGGSLSIPFNWGRADNAYFLELTNVAAE